MPAEIPVNVREIVWSTVSKLEKHMDLIEVLDSHILFADRKNTEALKELAAICKKIQKQSSTINVYRGFGSWSAQEDLGVSKEKPGDKITIRSQDKIISTTTDIEIAKAFGPSIVSMTLSAQKDNYLVISDELYYLIAKLRNHEKVMSQREVIILPPIDIQATIVQHQPKKSLFEKWLG